MLMTTPDPAALGEAGSAVTAISEVLRQEALLK